MNDDTIVVLTAMELEHLAVKELLTGIEPRVTQGGTLFEVGSLADGGRRVALATVGKGTHSTAVLAERAENEFKPAAILFVGVAGARRSHIELGDVVVATHVYAYHGGTSKDDGTKARPRVFPIPHRADQLARYLARHGGWARHLPSAPKVHFGPIASGEILLDSKKSAESRWLDLHYNDVFAIEMESAGLAQAAQLNDSLPAVVVRGISDFSDGRKAKYDRERTQPRAAANAAAFAAALIRELGHGRRNGSTAGQKGDTTMGATFSNNATGDARVGVQASVVHGGIHRVGLDQRASSSVGLADQIAELRAQLSQARAIGQLDDGTYEAAEAELAVVDTVQDQGRIILALKRLWGLVGDAADLGAKVAAVIAVVKGMS